MGQYVGPKLLLKIWCKSMCQNTLLAQGEQSVTPAQLKQMSVTTLHFQMSEVGVNMEALFL